MPAFEARLDPRGILTGAAQAKNAIQQVGDSLDKMKSKGGASTSALSSALKGMAGGLARIFAAYKAAEIAQKAFLNSARYETLGVVLHTVGAQAGYSAAQMDEYANSLRRTGIAGIEARETLTRLVQANIDLSKTSELARVAQNAAVIGGINSSEAFSRLVYGIQSSQVEVLRTIGLNVNWEQSYKKMAAQLGKNTAELTEAEKTQARVNVVMEAGANITGVYEAAMGTMGKQLTSLPRYWEDLLTDMGSFFTAAGEGVGVVGLLVSKLEGLNEWILKTQGLSFGLSFYEMERAIMEGGVQALRDLVLAQNSAEKEAISLEKAIGSLSSQGLDLSGITSELGTLKTSFEEGTILAKAYRRELSSLMAIAKAQREQAAYDDPSINPVTTPVIASVRAAYEDTSYAKTQNKLEELKKQISDLLLVKGELKPEEFDRMHKALTEEYNKAAGSSNKASSAAKKYQKTLKDIDDEIAQLTKTEKEYSRYQMEIKVAEWSAEGVPADKIAEYKKAFEESLSKTTFDEANKALQEFEKEYQQSMGNVAGITKSITSEMNQYREAAKAAFDAGNLGADEYYDTLTRITELQERRLLESSREMGAGIRLAFMDYQRDSTNAAKTAYDAMSNSMNGMEDALVSFVKTGKLSFSSLVDSMISDLARLAIQQSVTGPLFNALGTAVGSYFGGYTPTMEGTLNTDWSSWSSGAFANAKGGIYPRNSLAAYSGQIVSAPTLFGFAKGGVPNLGLMGEAGAEGIFPLTRTSTGDLGIKAVGNTQPVSVQIIDQRGSDAPPVEVQQSRNANGGTDIRVIVRAEVLNTFKSGAANGVMRNVFGLKPLAGGN